MNMYPFHTNATMSWDFYYLLSTISFIMNCNDHKLCDSQYFHTIISLIEINSLKFVDRWQRKMLINWTKLLFSMVTVYVTIEQRFKNLLFHEMLIVCKYPQKSGMQWFEGIAYIKLTRRSEYRAASARKTHRQNHVTANHFVMT